MKDVKEALELRNAKKKPSFRRTDSHKKAKISDSWRQPRGRHSPVRKRRKGYLKRLSVGYGAPRLARGLNPQGIKEVHVYNLKDLNKVQKDEGIIIGSNVGTRKKLEILKKINENKELTLLNIKDIDKFIKETEDRFKTKKEESDKRDKEKKKSKEEAVKKAEDKKKEEEKEEEKKTDEEKQEETEVIAREESRQKSMQQPV